MLSTQDMWTAYKQITVTLTDKVIEIKKEHDKKKYSEIQSTLDTDGNIIGLMYLKKSLWGKSSEEEKQYEGVCAI